MERFISVVAWSVSTLRPLMFGVAPYNPILGETHHVSRGTLNVLLEQVIDSVIIFIFFNIYSSSMKVVEGDRALSSLNGSFHLHQFIEANLILFLFTSL